MKEKHFQLLILSAAEPQMGIKMNRQKYIKKIEEVIEKGVYQDNWASLTNFTVPQWFRNAKFGLFIHWGLYSVPAFGSEWYSRNMYIQGTPEYEHHLKTYGPHKDFGYKDFIPLFKAERFNSKEWIDIFARSGAKYIVPVAEHHDGFQMYESEFSDWNAAKMGPKKDIIRELREACQERGLVFAASSHRAEHHWFMGHGRGFDSDIKEPLSCGDFYWPSIPEQPQPYDLHSRPFPSQEFLEDWLVRTCEIIDKYQPGVIYFDWWIQHEAYKENLRKIIAYYYNRGREWGQEVGVCYKHDALAFGSGIVDVERGKFAEPKPYYWQTDTAVARNSWCHITTLDYKSSKEIIYYLIDVVSKNGNLLLNIGPRADGSIPEEERDILEDIGDWLEVNGEAIYGSKCWRYAEEGPTKEVEGQFSDGAASVGYTSQDFRFTAGNGSIYAICMKWPEDGIVTIRSLGESSDANKPAFYGLIRSVQILGSKEWASYRIDKAGLHVTAEKVKSDLPVVLKVTTE